MSFKDNLLKKININQTASKVINSIGPADSERKTDKTTMRHLLEMSPYSLHKIRDLDLFIKGDPDKKGQILVLDNELALYHTTADDVVLRKSPTIKEMVSIRNAIKILSDSDVVISKREESVNTIRKESIDLLDLSFTKSDLEQIEREGSASLENAYADGVTESLSLFAELLGFSPPPKAFKIRHCEIMGHLTKKASGEMVFGPTVIYSLAYNTLKLIEKKIGSFDKGQMEYFKQVVEEKQENSKEEFDVFQYLKEAVIQKFL
ncbi:MAG: hypothetical protein HKO79_08615 [Desulfobacterales bacterium]|nr:hypothetical protein [Deltaproteobacteria bacterium]NNL42544.1 hypothetical protein [Desulfobacterales bacterium]